MSQLIFRISMFFIMTFATFTLVNCSSSSDNLPSSSPPVTRVSSTEALQEFKTRQAFASVVKKTLVANEKFYSLVFAKQSAQESFHSSLVVHSNEGIELSAPQLPDHVNLMDFDISQNGSIVELGFETVNGVADGFLLKELSIYIDSKKAFTFLDSKQDQAVTYDKVGNARPSLHFAKGRTLFTTTRSYTQFARVHVLDDKIWISAYGTFGYKIFCFDYSGNELSQVELIPQTFYSIMIVDTDAPNFEVTDRGVFAATGLQEQDSLIFQRHFGVDLKWQGAKFQTLIQGFDLSLTNRSVQLVNTSKDFLLPGIAANKNQIVTFGEIGGPGDRKAFVVVFNHDLNEAYRTEFQIDNETFISAALFHKDKLLVAGNTGSVQVATGSVVNPPDSYISSISPNGTVTTLSRFGTNRNDGVLNLLAVGSSIYVSGYKDGPITHTADSDQSQGYQYWFLGRLKQ